MAQNIGVVQASSSNQIILSCHRFAPSILAVLYALVVFLNFFGAGKSVLLCARLLLFMLSALYVAVRLLPQRENRWSWSARAEAWCAVKESAASAADYCRRNYTRVIYYVVLFLYGTALLFVDEVKDGRYVIMVSLLAPALVAVAKLIKVSLAIEETDQGADSAALGGLGRRGGAGGEGIHTEQRGILVKIVNRTI